MSASPAALNLALTEQALVDALTWKDASLVIYRHGILVEFKTELLAPGLTPTSEGRYRGWQIGPSEGHHCHLDLSSVVKLWFDAEPVSCQGGRLNYTLWFCSAADCGNPYRPDGLFSVTLNAPYRPDGSTRRDVVDPAYALFDRIGSQPGVSASSGFCAARSAAESRR